jgi:hypothetical protein
VIDRAIISSLHPRYHGARRPPFQASVFPVRMSETCCCKTLPAKSSPAHRSRGLSLSGSNPAV